MKKIKIKGNDYVMVHERVKEFHNLYPNGSIDTKLVELTDRFITKTIVIPDVSTPERCFTGLSYEDVGSNNVNSTSALENCETSSVGRALGFLNIGIDTSIASFEEVNNAIENQESKKIKPIAADVNPISGEESDLITFGKHKGKKWSDVDEGYVEWVASKSNVEWQRDQAQAELDSRGSVSVPDNSNAEGFSEKELQETEDHNKEVIEEKIPF